MVISEVLNNTPKKLITLAGGQLYSKDSSIPLYSKTFPKVE
jgi:hypothetical protein